MFDSCRLKSGDWSDFQASGASGCDLNHAAQHSYLDVRQIIWYIYMLDQFRRVL